MARLIIFGATGSLGRHVLRQALVAGHQVTAFVRTPSRLPPEAQTQVRLHTGDFAASADAVAVMVANLDRGSAMARCRVGLALPSGMRGRKPRWTAKPREVIP